MHGTPGSGPSLGAPGPRRSLAREVLDRVVSLARGAGGAVRRVPRDEEQARRYPGRVRLRDPRQGAASDQRRIASATKASGTRYHAKRSIPERLTRRTSRAIAR